MRRYVWWITVVLLFAGCAPVVPDEKPTKVEQPAPEPPPVAVEQPTEAVPTEEEILAATQAVYDSYVALSTQELSAEEEAACRKSMFANMSRARWGIIFDEEEWATSFFYWLGSFPIDEESELPYLLLPHKSTDGAYTDAYCGALATQFIAHPNAFLKLISVHENRPYYCGYIAYGAYPHEWELHVLLCKMQDSAQLTEVEGKTVEILHERIDNIYDTSAWWND